MNHCQIYHRFARFRQVFVIFAQPAIPTQPGKRPFDNPKPRADDKPFWLCLGSFLDVQLPTAFVPDPIDELSCIGTIRPDEAQALDFILDLLKHQFGTIAILDIGATNDDGND